MEIDSPAPTDFAPQFISTASIPSSERPGACHSLVDEILSASPADRLPQNLTAYLIFILDHDAPIAGVYKPAEPLSLISSRPLLTSFTQRLAAQPSADLRVAVAESALRLIQPRAVSFEEQDAALKHALADAHEANDDFAASARTLAAVNLSRAGDAAKAAIWVRIARCHLEEGNSVDAAAWISRAKQVQHRVADPAQRLYFHISHARILDSQRAFLDAAAAYHALSYEPSVDEDDRARSLAAAITCAVLAPAGPPRSRALAKLYKDDRSAGAEDFPILEKVFLDRMVTAEEVAAFAGKLEAHQRAATADGSTVVERAMLEHNLLGASRLYANIGTDELGALLGVAGDSAERYAAGMIGQGRLAGHVDQIERRVFFEGGKGAAAGGAGELRRWDANVRALAEEVESVTTMIQTQFPDFYTAAMA